MKTFSRRYAAVVFGFSLILAGQFARGEITVESTSSFGNVTIDPSEGTIDYIGATQSSAYSQAGGNSQYASIDPSAANSADIPVPGGTATGTGTGSALLLTGSAGATGIIPGATAGFDTSTGRASVNGEFEITGASAPVNVTFSTVFNGELSLSSDSYGVFGQGETDFALSIDGSPVLFADQILSIGPNQSVSTPYADALTGSLTLDPNTPYWFVGEADAETDVVNGTAAVVPEPSDFWLIGEGLAMLGLIASARRRWTAKAAGRPLSMLLCAAIAGMAATAQAKYIGGDAPAGGTPGRGPSTQKKGGPASASLTEGNVQAQYVVPTIKNASGTTLPFVLTYNSYNADGSKAQLNTGVGFGWTHTYNSLLFQQRGQMFQLGEDGRVTQFFMNYTGSGGTYSSDKGYFETLTVQPDGTYYLTNKYQSWWHYGSVPNTPFLVGGPVYRLLQMGDRNHNVTFMTYNANGLLVSATDPYGRTLQFTYNPSNELSSVTDPLGQTTTFQYDPMYRMPTEITDPLGKTIQYTYNAQYQMTREVDQDGRMYFYTYKSLEPFMAADGNGQPYFSLENPTDWAVDQTNLAYSLDRQYVPSTTTSTDGRGNQWQYVYDSNGYITQMTDPLRDSTLYTYDPSTLMLTGTTDPLGHTTINQYDSAGNRVGTTDPLGNLTTWTYDSEFNRVTSMTDPLGNITTWQYDSDGDRISSTDPLGHTETWTYDSRGNVLTSTDADGHTTTNTYDSSGNRVSATDPLGDVTTWQYDADGNRLQTTDPLGNITRNQYDADNRLTTTIDPMGRSTTTTYDEAGNVTSTTDPDGHTTTGAYDARGRLIDTTDPLGGITTWTYDDDDNRTSTIDPMGRTTTNQYDADDRQISVTDALGNVSRTSYDEDGEIISQTDRDGNTTSRDYDEDNRQIAVTDALGNVSYTEYDEDGNVISRTDADGHAAEFDYDALNRVITTTDALGNVSHTEYDADGNVISQTDADGHTTHNQYDGDNRVLESIDAVGNVSHTRYDEDGNVISETDGDGNVTTNTYDADNRQITTTDALGDVRTTIYDADGEVISQTDGDGNVTTNTYDADNRQITTTDALGDVRTTIYDADGNVISETDADGNTTSYSYDAVNRVVSETNAVLSVTRETYDADGNVLMSIDAEGNTTTYMYDALGRQTNMTDPVSIESSQTYYDGVGNVLSSVDANGNVTIYTYDPVNRRLTETNSNGGVSSITYDGVGNVISTEDGDGNTTFYTYDGLNRQIMMTDARGNTNYTSYDADGNVLSTTDADGNMTSYTYDELGRQIGSEEPVYRSTSTTYDDNGNVLSTTDEDGHTTTYTYDALNRLISERYPDTPPRTVSYTYDADGNILLVTDQDAQVTQYSYDPIGLELSGSYQGGGLSDTYTYDASGRVISAQRGGWTVTYTYDGDGRVVSTTQNGLTVTYTYDVPGRTRTVTYPSGRAITETYDDRDRLITITDGSTNTPIVAYTYDASDRVVSRAYRNGVVTTYTYDSDNRVTAIQNMRGATLIAGENYEYDADGNMLYEQQLDEPAMSKTYMYDGLDRLTNYEVGTLSGGTISSPSLEATWSLDGAGNWLSVTSNGVPLTRDYSTDNELTNLNGQTLTYDADGDLLLDATYSYSYDEEHRLTNVTRLSDSADVGQYFYDAEGREVMKITDASGAPATNVYYYDDNRMIEQRDGGDNVVATYVYDTDGNEVLTMDRGGQTYYYHQNGHQSPYVLTDTNGAAVERYSYDAYGHVTIMDGSYNPLPPNSWGTAHSAVSNAWLFIGRQFNEETGLYTYLSRVYDTLQGRYLQRNQSSQNQPTNLYEYASDNPATSTNSSAGRRTPSWWPHGTNYDEWGRRPIVDEWDRIIGWEHQDGNTEIVLPERELDRGFDRGLGGGGRNCAQNRNLYEIGFMVGGEFVPGYCVLKIECKGADGKTAAVTATIIGSLQVCAPSEGAAKSPGIVFGVVAPKVNQILQQLREYRGVSAQIQSIKFRDAVVARKIADGCCGDAGGFNDIPSVSLQVPSSLFTGRPSKEGEPPDLGFTVGEYFLRKDRPHGGIVFDSEKDLPINKGIP